jgi:hypothetical protein
MQHRQFGWPSWIRVEQSGCAGATVSAVAGRRLIPRPRVFAVTGLPEYCGPARVATYAGPSHEHPVRINQSTANGRASQSMIKSVEAGGFR